LLDKLSKKAHNLIRIIALESSGIRDGDGYWHGSDGFGGTVEGLIEQFREIEVFDARQEDDFGLCPECHRNDGYLNVGRTHIFICHEHKTAWIFGDNVFSDWREQTEETFEENKKLLDGYREVKPFFWHGATSHIIEFPPVDGDIPF